MPAESGSGITGEETVRGILRILGLTDKEAEVYIFLSKHGVLKCGEIAKGMKRHTAQIYRILKILQTKGLLESTLEAPTRFTAVPFETVLDLSIKAKRDEASQMEKTRQEILSYWKSIHQPRIEPPLGKFVVIEGNNKIYPKIAQIVKETKNQLSTVATVSGLARADQFGIFDAISAHPLRSKIQFRFLTDLSNQNIDAMKTVLKRIPENRFNLKGRTPEIGLQSPRMVIKDEEEILFFITPRPDSPATEHDVCLWTDCKELVRSFSTVFEDLWRNSTDIEQKIAEIENSITSERIFKNNAEEAEKTFREILESPKKSIIILTSSQGLTNLYEKNALIETWVKKGVSARVLAPITSENLNAAMRLSKHCPVRHITSGYLPTTIVDGKHLFHFDAPSPELGKGSTPKFTYTTDHARIKRVGLMLNSIWKGASSPSTVPTDTLGSHQTETADSESVAAFAAGMKVFQTDNWKKAEKTYSTVGNVLIHPPSQIGIPAMRISAFHYEKESLFGEGNSLYIWLRLKTPKGYYWAPVSGIETNEKALIPSKAIMLGAPTAKSFQLVKPDELQVRKQGNTLFAGWTVQIPLPPTAHILPPTCMLFEAYGQSRHVLQSSPVGNFISMYESDNYDAFVTFLDPSWKYSAPGTHGQLCTNVVGAVLNPRKNSA